MPNERSSGAPSDRPAPPVSRVFSRNRRAALLAALIALLYVAAAASYPWSKPGLYYDEAIVVRDAVQMLASPDRPEFSYEPRSWARALGRAWPIMDLPYLGAVKAYSMVVPFAIFGTSTGVVRTCAVLLTALGIWGIAWTLARDISPGVAAAAGMMIAIDPAFLDQTVYDNNVVGIWIATLGMIALAFSRHLRRRSNGSALLLGFACGFAVWGRLNFLWLLGSIGTALLVWLPEARAELRRRAAALAAGFAVGAAPVVFYEIWTHFGTLRYMERAPARGLAERAGRRLYWLAETLLSDQEHRGIWGGPPLPALLVTFVAAFAAAGVVLATVAHRGADERAGDAAWRRASGLAAILFAAIMLTSRMAIAEHHLVTLVPVVAVAAALGFRRAATGPVARSGVLAAAAIFLAAALHWNFRSAAAIRASGGRGMWSDAIDDVAATLAREAPGPTARVLSWGLANNVFVLSDGAVCPSEAFWGATAARSAAGLSWREEIARGGYFLVGQAHAGAAGRDGFLRALVGSGARYRLWEYRERHGEPYARLFDVAPARHGAPVTPAGVREQATPPPDRGTRASTDRRAPSG